MVLIGFDSLADMYQQWGGSEAECTKPGTEVLFVEYDCDGYEGSAFCVLRCDGQLYEAHDLHCSCNGLENFDLEETSAAALRMRRRALRSLDFRTFLESLEASA